MSRRLLWTKSAELDVVEIWLHIAEDNITEADKMAHRIQSKCEKLSENPGSGVRRPELGKTVRSSPIENYVIFYESINDDVLVKHVVHGARDIDAIFRFDDL